MALDFFITTKFIRQYQKRWLIVFIGLYSLNACQDKAPVQFTPLKNFEAPFVFGRFQTPEDNPLSEESVRLGRFLFYEKRLSGNNQFSCATCHDQKLAFTDGRLRGVGVSGKLLEFNTMSLANLLWGPQHFFWNGRRSSLEEQALDPIQNPDEMDQNLDELIIELKSDQNYISLFEAAYGEINAYNIARALSAFQRTLISANSRYDQFLRGELRLSDLEEKGRKLFMAHPDTKVDLRGGNCIDCHSQFVTAGFKEFYDGFSNNGLDDEASLSSGLQAVTNEPAHKGMFKVPSLRNVALTAPYMHDGRFETLQQVLDHYNEGIKQSSTLSLLIVEADNRQSGEILEKGNASLHLNEVEKEAIIAFLHTLTDYGFISDTQFSDPFVSPVSGTD